METIQFELFLLIKTSKIYTDVDHKKHHNRLRLYNILKSYHYKYIYTFIN